MKTPLAILLLSTSTLLSDQIKPPVEGELVRLSGNTNKHVVVWVPEKSYPVHCLTNGTIVTVWRHDGPTFLGVSPTNDLSQLTIVPWPPKRKPEDLRIKEMEEDGSLTNVINLLATSGKLCAVKGHAWGSHLHVTLEYDQGRIGCRECKVCKLHQSQYASDWK